MIKLLVFDFDGTLADTKQLAFNIIKQEVEKKGFSLPRNFKKFMGNNQLKKDLISLGLELKTHIVGRRINKIFIKNVNKIKLAKNIRSLAKIKKPKIILTNNTAEFVKACLKKFKISFFSEIYGSEKVKDKVEGLRKIMRKRKLRGNEIVYIGDIRNGAKICKKSGCTSILISTKISWDSRKEILKAKPDFIINDLKEVKKIVDKLDKRD